MPSPAPTPPSEIGTTVAEFLRRKGNLEEVEREMLESYDARKAQQRQQQEATRSVASRGSRALSIIRRQGLVDPVGVLRRSSMSTQESISLSSLDPRAQARLDMAMLETRTAWGEGSASSRLNHGMAEPETPTRRGRAPSTLGTCIEEEGFLEPAGADLVERARPIIAAQRQYFAKALECDIYLRRIYMVAAAREQAARRQGDPHRSADMEGEGERDGGEESDADESSHGMF
ncbi:hypothetical protein QBC39DRAFT_364436 [Podospora conica]|nr:hypothetical protein QBC39DRAFT_364436 [Schizothecium conicum]